MKPGVFQVFLGGFLAAMVTVAAAASAGRVPPCRAPTAAQRRHDAIAQWVVENGGSVAPFRVGVAGGACVEPHVPPKRDNLPDDDAASPGLFAIPALPKNTIIARVPLAQCGIVSLVPTVAKETIEYLAGVVRVTWGLIDSIIDFQE
jgi:hypothetical protein